MFQGKHGPTMNSKAKIKDSEWQNRPPRPWLAGGTPLKRDEMSEADVIFRQGEFVSGEKQWMFWPRAEILIFATKTPWYYHFNDATSISLTLHFFLCGGGPSLDVNTTLVDRISRETWICLFDKTI